MIKTYALPPIQFAFGDDRVRQDKLRGLQEFGPFRRLSAERKIRFAFVFPVEYRDHANRLYLALKNGIGYFKGVESTFRFALDKSQVTGITGFSIKNRDSHASAKLYVAAIRNWFDAKNDRPDLVFLIHPETAVAELDTPYYDCKAILLEYGLLSQNVTAELIEDAAKFQWSAANIALGSFVKLGGIPWVLQGKELEQDLIIGIGRSYLYDAASRLTTGYIGFTACFSARGTFKFLSLGEVAATRTKYLDLLQNVVADSIARSNQLNQPISSLTIHVPKEMGKEEMRAIRAAAYGNGNVGALRLSIAKINEEYLHFAIDDRFPDGIPKRGTVVQISDRDFLLYTEGREETEPWTSRLPVALRVTPQDKNSPPSTVASILRQINDLSQVNWRGFNARSQPISVYYGTLIAQLLSHVPHSSIEKLQRDEVRSILEGRMWFL